MAYIVVATGNRHKFEEYRQLLAGQDLELKSLADFPNAPEVVEDGATFAENATKKAVEVGKYCDAATFADDSGLEVAALGGAPGIYSARYAASDAERIDRVLNELRGKTDRGARFVCVIALAFNGEVIATFEGEVRGTICDAPRGTGGFGYDPIFVPDGYEQTFGEMPQELKNRISHRAMAVKKALEFVEDQMAAFEML